MKIEKKKVVKSTLSSFTKRTVAAALGISASIGLGACEDITGSTIVKQKPQEPEPLCGIQECGNQLSSSSYTDISSSGERLSSSAIEALSSAIKPKSSSSFVPPPQAGILPPYENDYPREHKSSSSEVPLSSSSEVSEPLAGDPIFTASSSSESTPSTKSSNSNVEIKIIEIDPDSLKQEKKDTIIDIDPRKPFCEDSSSDPRCRVNICKDSDGCMIFSMVTTFERDDIQA